MTMNWKRKWTWTKTSACENFADSEKRLPDGEAFPVWLHIKIFQVKRRKQVVDIGYIPYSVLRATGTCPKGKEEQIAEQARPLLYRLIEEGTEEFRVGGAVGFDMIMAVLLKLRDGEKKPIRIVSVIPYPGWRAKWNEAEKARQDEILRKSDRVVYIRRHYCRGIYMIRNRALLQGVLFSLRRRPENGF